MNRLTHRLPNKEAVMKPLDPDCGSCQNCKKQTRHFQILIDRLAMHEDVAEQRNRLLTLHTETVCDKYCKYPIECKNQEELDLHCNSCELVSLWNAVITVEPGEVEMEKKTAKEPEEGEFVECKDGYCGIVTGVTDSKWGRMIIIATSDMRTYHFPLSELAD
ncbi:MAG: hypothetical protein ACK5MV_13590 [Aminipila sp.]